MDSIDAQCLLVDMADDPELVPPHWLHGGDGSLHFRFSEGSRTMGWEGRELAKIARRWRAARRPRPAAIARMADAHERFLEILDHGELDRPDVVSHDLIADEVRAMWVDRKLVVIVELDDPAGSAEDLVETLAS